MNISIGMSGLNQEYLDRRRRGPFAAAQEETIFYDGTGYRLSVLSNEDGLPVAYRLRPKPIDPAVDYSNRYEEFVILGSVESYGKGGFEAALEKFYEKDNEFERLMEDSKRLYK